MRSAAILLVLAALVFSGPVEAVAQPSQPKTGGDTLELPIPGGLRLPDASLPPLRIILRADSLWLIALMDSLDRTTHELMRRNLMMAPSDWMPTEAEKRAREQEIWNAMGMNEIHRGRYVPLFSANLNSLMMSIGVVEDVTPRIKYELDHTSAVTVVIYTMDAQRVVTLVSGSHPPGVYDFEWDFRDENGTRVPYGSYIAEVIVDRVMVMRKRILVP